MFGALRLGAPAVEVDTIADVETCSERAPAGKHGTVADDVELDVRRSLQSLDEDVESLPVDEATDEDEAVAVARDCGNGVMPEGCVHCVLWEREDLTAQAAGKSSAGALVRDQDRGGLPFAGEDPVQEIACGAAQQRL